MLQDHRRIERIPELLARVPFEVSAKENDESMLVE
jgi:hypothetical protein